MELKIIKLDKMKPNEWNPNVMDKVSYEKLGKRIVEDGFLTAVVVRRVGDKYEIIDGEHRWRKAKELGLREMPAIVLETDEEKAKYLTLGLNAIRGEINERKLWRLVERLTAKGYDPRVIEDYLMLEDGSLVEALKKDKESISKRVEYEGQLEEIERKVESGVVEENEEVLMSFELDSKEYNDVMKVLIKLGKKDLSEGVMYVLEYFDKLGVVLGDAGSEDD